MFRSFDIILLIFFFLFIEWLGREGEHALAGLSLHKIRGFRYVFYYILIVLIFLFSGKEQEFIYFQF